MSKTNTDQDNGIDQILIDKAAALGLDPNKGEIAKICQEDGDWVIIITRQGYRKAVAEQPDYIRHVVYPIYDTTRVLIKGDVVEVEIVGEMSNLMGAIGFLYKRDMDGFFIYQVSLSDYEHLVADSKFWKTMPHSAIQKNCEIALIRMAYPELFGNVYAEEEFAEKKGDKRSDMIKLIRQNISVAAKYMPENIKLESLSTGELKQIINNMQEP